VGTRRWAWGLRIAANCYHIFIKVRLGGITRVGGELLRQRMIKRDLRYKSAFCWSQGSEGGLGAGAAEGCKKDRGIMKKHPRKTWAGREGGRHQSGFLTGGPIFQYNGTKGEKGMK